MGRRELDNPALGLLGPFELRCNGRTSNLPKKAQALLAYLALNRGGPVPRERLAALLWDRVDAGQARRSLRQCLADAKAALGADAPTLVAAGQELRLDIPRIDVDALKFDALCASADPADLDRAAALYRDELLCGLRITSQLFNEWLDIERRRFASRCSDALMRLALARWDARQLAQALAAIERLKALEPLREDGHRLHLRILAALGRRAAALQEHQSFSEVLRRELNVAPDLETLRVVEAVRRDQSAVKPVQGKEPVQSKRERPSIAVLPLANLSDSPEHDYFADGITEELTVALGRFPWLFILASGSAFSFREGCADVQRIGAELGVQYVLRGSLRKSGQRLRLTVQLADASQGRYLWSDRFEGRLDDVFAIQDKVATQVAGSLVPTLHALEIERACRQPTDSLSAYDLYLRAVPRFRASLRDNREALSLLSKAIAADPLYATAYGMAARCYQFQKIMGWLDPDDPSLLEGVRLARTAAELGSHDSEALWMAGTALCFLVGDLEHSKALIQRSLAINSNSAYAWVSMTFVHGLLGELDEALGAFNRAQELNPRDSTHHFNRLAPAIAYFVAGRYEDADRALDLTLAESPSYPPAIRIKVATSALRGRIEQAVRWKDRLLSLNPACSMDWMQRFFTPHWKHHPEAIRKLLAGMRDAGLPERAG